MVMAVYITNIICYYKHPGKSRVRTLRVYIVLDFCNKRRLVKFVIVWSLSSLLSRQEVINDLSMFSCLTHVKRVGSHGRVIFQIQDSTSKVFTSK